MHECIQGGQIHAFIVKYIVAMLTWYHECVSERFEVTTDRCPKVCASVIMTICSLASQM